MAGSGSSTNGSCPSSKLVGKRMCMRNFTMYSTMKAAMASSGGARRTGLLRGVGSQINLASGGSFTGHSHHQPELRKKPGVPGCDAARRVLTMHKSLVSANLVSGQMSPMNGAGGIKAAGRMKKGTHKKQPQNTAWRCTHMPDNTSRA